MRCTAKPDTDHWPYAEHCLREASYYAVVLANGDEHDLCGEHYRQAHVEPGLLPHPPPAAQVPEDLTVEVCIARALVAWMIAEHSRYHALGDSYGASITDPTEYDIDVEHAGRTWLVRLEEVSG